MAWAVHRGGSGAGESVLSRRLSVPTGQRVHVLHHVEAHRQRGDDQGAAGPQRARLQLGEGAVIQHGQGLPVELHRPGGPGEVSAVAVSVALWCQPQPPASDLLGVEPVLAVGLQQVLVDNLIPQRPCQLDFLPGAVQVDDVKGDGSPDIVVTAVGRVGDEGCTATSPGSITSERGLGGLCRDWLRANIQIHCPAAPAQGHATFPSSNPVLWRHLSIPPSSASRDTAQEDAAIVSRAGVAQDRVPVPGQPPQPCKEEAENGGELCA